MKITAGTIARTIILALALINQILAACGIKIIPVDDDTINTLVATAFTAITAVIAWWKNNSFTSKAIAADAYMKDEKSEGEVTDVTALTTDNTSNDDGE